MNTTSTQLIITLKEYSDLPPSLLSLSVVPEKSVIWFAIALSYRAEVIEMRSAEKAHPIILFYFLLGSYCSCLFLY